ncbi:MAG: endonuclease/exonuclease/phosphatase family protein [Bacteroidia bacterium]
MGRILAFAVLIIVGYILAGCEPVANTDQNQEPQTGTRSLSNENSSSLPTDKDLNVAFYNVENLFDAIDDPKTNDNDFTPDGELHWTDANYRVKLKNLAKVIASLDADVLGMAEVENREVLEDLIAEPALASAGYAIVHEHSSDGRGIDVAMLYRPASFQYVKHSSHRPKFSEEAGYRSRDVLQVQGKTADGSNLYLFVNHWPSRRGGQAESEVRRLVLARLVRGELNKIRKNEPNARFLLMGDFNDDPHNKGIMEVLDSKADPALVPDDGLFNPMRTLHDPESYGSLTYKGKWNLFDQFLISEDLVKASKGLHYVSGSAKVYSPDWMRVGYGRSAEAPRRAIFRGEFRPDGFSDHFPIQLKLVID